jgi:hypothetical protein
MYKVDLTYSCFDYTIENGIEWKNEFITWLKETDKMYCFKQKLEKHKDKVNTYVLSVWVEFENKDDAIQCKLIWG